MNKVFMIIMMVFLSLPVSVLCQTEPGKFKAKEPVTWFREGIMYQIWLRSFTPEGTIQAAEKRLHYLKDLGVTIVYLPPIMLADTLSDRSFWSPRQKASPGGEARNPYKIVDYFKIDPEYGNDEDLKNFVKTAHGLGLRVILDLVYVHTGPSSNLTKDRSNYLLDSTGAIKKNGWNFLRLDHNYLPLRKYLISNMEYWLSNFNLDGFRCDVSGSVPVDFWQEARIAIEKVKPDVAMLGESNSPKELLKAFDASYGFPWFEELKNVVVAGESAEALKNTWLKQNKDFPKGSLFIRYSDNHDQNRSDLVFGEAGSRAINVLNFTLDGIPFLYNGQEIGDGSPFGLFEHWPILWESQGLPQKTELRNWYKELIHLRKSTPTLYSGQTTWLKTSKPESVIAFLRKTQKETVLIIVNLSNRKTNVTIELPERKNQVFASRMRMFDRRTEHNSNPSSPQPERKAEKSVAGKLTVSLDGFGYFVGLN